MGYLEDLEQAEKESKNRAVATKILDKMEELRLTSNEDVSRRWIWELLQNARDVASSSGQIDIAVDLREDSNLLVFMHNGNPFTSSNIVSLIEQVSSKERDSTLNEEEINTTGKFGTGFLTTHLLSEIVHLKGLLKNTEGECKPIEVTLDRSGRELQSITDSINITMAQLRAVEEAEEAFYNNGEYQTQFTYELNDTGLEVARKGLDDLEHLIPYVLTFVKEIRTVNIMHANKIYKLTEESVLGNGTVNRATIQVSQGNTLSNRFITTMQGTALFLAAEVELTEDGYAFVGSDYKLPKLFCTFPLIGSGDFPFPFIINSGHLNPNEPRSGVFLTDKDEEKVWQNKEILIKAVSLAQNFVNLTADCGWRKFYVPVKYANSSINVDWVDNEWLNENVKIPIRNHLVSSQIVDDRNGNRTSIISNEKINVLIPFSTAKKTRESLYKLTSYLTGEPLTRVDELHDWYSSIWRDLKKLDIYYILRTIESLGEIKELSNQLNNVDVYNWLEVVFKMAENNDKIVEEIIAEKLVIIPNQNGVFTRYSELYIDEGIDGALKDITADMGHDCREILLDKLCYLPQGLNFSGKTTKGIAAEINNQLEELDWENKIRISKKIATLYSEQSETIKQRRYIFYICKKVYGDTFGETKKLTHWNHKIWEYADNYLIEDITNIIMEQNNIESLSQYLCFQTGRECTLWLKTLIESLVAYEYSSHLNTKSILPNQLGQLKEKEELFLDDEIDDELKEICMLLGYDYREELLDINFDIDIPSSREISNKEVAEKITSLVRATMHEFEQSSETKYALRTLMQWFQDYGEVAEGLFTDLWPERHRLLSGKEIMESFKKAEQWDELNNQLLEKTGCSTIEEAFAVIRSNNISMDKEDDKIVLDQDVLAQLGITSEEELKEAFKSKKFADIFTHDSEVNQEKFYYVQEIIDRSIKNVCTHIQANLQEYDYTTLEAIPGARTIFAIEKNGEEVYLIIRPSDYKQIIIFYDSEKDYLDYNKDVELWVDNDVDIPERITFGRILKVTGINRIPLYRVKR